MNDENTLKKGNRYPALFG